MSKTLVIILSESKADELTFNNFKKNVIDELNADLCLCFGIKSDYNVNNPFYNLAKFKFLYVQPEYVEDAFEYAYNVISRNRPKYEKLENINALYGKLENPNQLTDNITYYGDFKNISNIEDFNDDEIVVHTDNFADNLWKNKVYGIKKTENNLISQENVTTYKKALYWREFLKLNHPSLAGIKDNNFVSDTLLIFFKWFLLKNLNDNDIISNYERFIITKSDFMYQLPHPKVEYMNENCIWNLAPDNDNHVVLSKHNIEPYLNIFNHIVLRSNDYFMKMQNNNDWDLKQLLKFHFEENNLTFFNNLPHIMYSVQDINCHDDYNKSTYYKNYYEQSGLTIDEFYKSKNIYKSILICRLPTSWQSNAGFMVYPLFFINSILYCKQHSDIYFKLPVINFDTCLNRYKDDHNKMWSNYFEMYDDKQKNISFLYKSLADYEYDDIHHHFGVQTYPYGRGKYKDYKEYYDKPYNHIINEFYLKNRKIANEIITTYLKINDHITEKVDLFWKKNLSLYNYVIGIHLRGTDKDKNIGGRKVLPSEYYKYIDYLLNKHNNSIIFLATDDPSYLFIVKEKYKEKIVYIDDIARNSSNILYCDLGNNYKKGEDVLIDCLCLSKCDFLIHSSSAVSEFAIYYNINLHEHNFNLQYDCSALLNHQ